MTMTTPHAKAKVFSHSPRMLQLIADRLSKEFGKSTTISSIQPAKEGDYFIFVNWFGEDAQP